VNYPFNIRKHQQMEPVASSLIHSCII